jgi:hypothetical protein
MKVWIQKIKAPELDRSGPDGEVLAWRPMVLELVVDAPKDQEAAAAQFAEAERWAYPSERHGNLMVGPPALELAPPFKWPTCEDCDDPIVLRDRGDHVCSSEQYVAECPSCKGGCTAATPMEAIQEFARELGG